MAGLWYRVGTISVTNGSKKVTGFGTQFKTGTYKPDKGHTFWGPDGKHYEVDYVESDTVLYLVQAYTGATAAGQSYEIDITRTGTIPALSREVSAMLAYAQGQYDGWQQILTGSGNVTLAAPDGQSVSVPALSNMLSKSGNLAGLGDIRLARQNMGLKGGSAAPVEDDINLPTKLMRWENYGTGHTIFDASKAVSPGGTSIDRLNPQVPWNDSLPNLMGWNGANTYGVRVDSARIADTVKDHVSGTFTPIVYGLDAAGSPVYSIAAGLYSRKGDEVKFELTVMFSSLYGASGIFHIGGLPFVSRPETSVAVSVAAYNGLSDQVSVIGAVLGALSSAIYINCKTGSSNSARGVQCSDFTSGDGIIVVSGSYIII